MPKFLTIFPNAENVHLIKDVGMIPYTLHREYGYDSTIASYKNGVYPYYETEVKGITQVFISKKFNNNVVLNGIDLNINKGDVVAIIGPSGTGKSTFLRCLNRLEKIGRAHV